MKILIVILILKNKNVLIKWKLDQVERKHYKMTIEFKSDLIIHYLI